MSGNDPRAVKGFDEPSMAVTSCDSDLSKPIKAPGTHVVIGYDRRSVIEYNWCAEMRGQMSATTEEDDLKL